jgi:hypothetical protein
VKTEENLVEICPDQGRGGVLWVRGSLGFAQYGQIHNIYEGFQGFDVRSPL